MKLSNNFLFLAAATTQASAFVVPSPSAHVAMRQTSFFDPASILNMSDDDGTVTADEGADGEEDGSKNGGRGDFVFSFEIPKKGIADIGTAEVSLPPLLEKSEVLIVRYDLPFGLNAEPDAASGQVVVTKDGKPDGGERVGDILRQTTYWRGSTPGLFDVSKNADNFDLVVQALITNDLSVADEIVLVFERPL